MGYSSYSHNVYASNASVRAASGRSAFHYTDDVMSKAPVSEWKCNDRLNPKGVIRESRDSEAHPNSVAVGVMFDVTGSMMGVPRILQKSLSGLFGLLIRKGWLTDPQVLFGGFGDATCDRVPLQIGQFESGNELEADLEAMFLEGGGGGQLTESYEIALYFMARKTSIDCFEKRGHRGYLFMFGDEKSYPAVKRHEVERLIGDKLQEDISTKDIVAEVTKKYDTYFIIPGSTSHWQEGWLIDHWTGLFGQNVLRLDDPAAVCELLASTIGLAEGNDLDSIGRTLVEAGYDKSVKSVEKALTVLADSGRGGGGLELPSSGGLGITTL